MKKLLLLLGCALGLAVMPAVAQSSIATKVYWLTNSTGGFSFTNGLTAVATTITTNIFSQPFPIWRGRGFTFNEAFTPASSSTAGLTNVLQFATPINTPTGWQTNWSTYGNSLTLVALANGTAKVFFSTNITPAMIDNCTLGRLQTIVNLSAVTMSVDPTNTYISAFP